MEKSSENSLDLPLGVVALNKSAVRDLLGLPLIGETIDSIFSAFGPSPCFLVPIPSSLE